MTLIRVFGRYLTERGLPCSGVVKFFPRILSPNTGAKLPVDAVSEPLKPDGSFEVWLPANDELLDVDWFYQVRQTINEVSCFFEIDIPLSAIRTGVDLIPIAKLSCPGMAAGGDDGGGDGGDPEIIPVTTEITAMAATVLFSGHVVALDVNGKAYSPDYSVIDDIDRVVGLAATSALVGEEISIITLGPISSTITYAVGPLFVSSNGSLSSTPPNYPHWQLQVAVALSSTELFVNVQTPIILI